MSLLKQKRSVHLSIDTVGCYLKSKNKKGQRNAFLLIMSRLLLLLVNQPPHSSHLEYAMGNIK